MNDKPELKQQVSYRKRLWLINGIIWGGAALLCAAIVMTFYFFPTLGTWGLLGLFLATYGVMAVREEIRMIRRNRRVRVRCAAHRLRAPYSYMQNSWLCPRGCRVPAGELEWKELDARTR